MAFKNKKVIHLLGSGEVENESGVERRNEGQKLGHRGGKIQGVS